MKILVTILVLLACAVCMPAQQHRLADSAQQKLNHIVQNGQAARPDPNPTVLTEDEINDYFAAGRVVLPQGVKKVSFKGQSGVVTTFAVIDFDEIKQGQHTSNPLLSMFNGTHNVDIEADAVGTAGKGKVHVRTVTLDGIEVPKMALEYFVNKYIKPKYPNLGIDSEFQLPNKIDAATVGYHKLTVTQK
ncbi:MAG: hypothetical protein DMG65_07400 [Candidatus Angelobacter sp. Gp1-AA117]|nr:MAG: hypothetical protein DMG65_07400 [Candidatus Angelobacter sp. Gp1-AA117]